MCGGKLTADEFAFFRETRPAGFILFTRNCIDPAQLTSLVSQVFEAVQTDELLVLIDQEGGRVQRLVPPHWRQYPTALDLARLVDENELAGLDALRLVNRAIATDLRMLGINMNCTPVLDLPVPGAHDIIGNRAYGIDGEVVAKRARVVAAAHVECGVLPVIKHIPGHGRSTQDSHKALPVVDAPRGLLESTDFQPFKLLNDMPAAMTAHIVYSDIDDTAPASTSPIVIKDVIRDYIGFDGLLMSDDLSMQALDGSMASRTRDVLAAGCDLALHCNGDLGEMRDVAAQSPELSGEGLRRFKGALDVISGKNTEFGAEDGEKLEALIAELA